MTETASYPAGTTVYHCPLPACPWEYVLPTDWRGIQPPPGYQPGEPVTIAEIGRMRAMAVDSVLEAHLATHTTLEWVTEINRLTGIMAKVTNELADDGRIGSSLLTGALATRANLAREEAMDWLREGIASKRAADGGLIL